MQVAVARQSAATVLRTVLLYRAVEVAQCSDLAYLKGSFEGWLWCTKRDIRARIRDIEWLCVTVMHHVYHDDEEMASTWRQFQDRVERNFRMGQIRGATRQWVFNLWCTVCTAKIAAVAKTTSDEEAAMKAAAIVMAKKAAAMAMCKCSRIVADFHWFGPGGNGYKMVGSGKGSEYVATWRHQYMTDWYTKDGYGCH